MGNMAFDFDVNKFLQAIFEEIPACPALAMVGGQDEMGCPLASDPSGKGGLCQAAAENEKLRAGLRIFSGPMLFFGARKAFFKPDGSAHSVRGQAGVHCIA